MKSFFAAVMLFTRLPLWRIVQVEKRHYASALLYWPVVGFFTGATTWVVFYLASQVVTSVPACILAIIARIGLTGALHEDGLADFCDGFGGGRDKESILRIMKDSHIGTYGVIGLIAYFFLYTTLLAELSPCFMPFSQIVSQGHWGIFIGADVCAKFCTAVMVNSLPYARSEEESKTKVLYRKIRWQEFTLVGLVCLPVLWLLKAPFPALILPIVTIILFRCFLKRKIGGYTGDCCGATVLVAELSYYLGVALLFAIQLHASNFFGIG